MHDVGLWAKLLPRRRRWVLSPLLQPYSLVYHRRQPPLQAYILLTYMAAQYAQQQSVSGAGRSSPCAPLPRLRIENDADPTFAPRLLVVLQLPTSTSIPLPTLSKPCTSNPRRSGPLRNCSIPLRRLQAGQNSPLPLQDTARP